MTHGHTSPRQQPGSDPTEHWLALHLPHLAIDVLQRSVGDHRCLAIIDSEGSRRWIHDCNEPAAELGVRAGMKLDAAYALLPELHACPRHRPAERQGLAQVALAAYGLSDRVAILPPDVVVVEVGRSRRLLEQQGVRDFFDGLGYDVRYAAAPTARGACLLARAGCHRSIRRIADLGRMALGHSELEASTIKGLAGVGVHTIAEALALPRDGLARRFGPKTLDYLDRLTGRKADPLPWYQPPERFDATLELLQESEDAAALVFAASRLLRDLALFLEIRDLAIQRFRLQLHHAHGQCTSVMVGMLEPDRNPGRMTDLLRERMHHVVLPAPVIRLSLRASRPLPVATRNGDLFHHGSNATDNVHAWSRLVERLRSRLGNEAVQTPALAADHRPERAWRMRTEGAAVTPIELRQLPPRPLWLLRHPHRLDATELQLTSGPERIESGWWDDGDVARDYYVALDRGGQKLWVFRDCRGDRGWYLHGYFA